MDASENVGCSGVPEVFGLVDQHEVSYAVEVAQDLKTSLGVNYGFVRIQHGFKYGFGSSLPGFA